VPSDPRQFGSQAVKITVARLHRPVCRGHLLELGPVSAERAGAIANLEHLLSRLAQGLCVDVSQVGQSDAAHTLGPIAKEVDIVKLDKPEIARPCLCLQLELPIIEPASLSCAHPAAQRKHTWMRRWLSPKARGGRRAGRHRTRVCSTDPSMTSSFTRLHHPLTRWGFAQPVGVKEQKNRAVTRLGSCDSGRNPHPETILWLVGALRLQAQINSQGLLHARGPDRGVDLVVSVVGQLASVVVVDVDLIDRHDHRGRLDRVGRGHDLARTPEVWLRESSRSAASTPASWSGPTAPWVSISTTS